MITSPCVWYLYLIMFRCWTKKPELGWTRSSWLNLRKGSRQSRNFCRNFLMIQFRLRQCCARWLKQVNWEERWRSPISKISWKGEHGCQTCVCSSVDFPQDECWTSIKQSQIWSSACHGQWWRWWPWRPIIFLIFCKQLWSKWKDHTKNPLPSWLILVFLWCPFSGFNFCCLEKLHWKFLQSCHNSFSTYIDFIK